METVHLSLGSRKEELARDPCGKLPTVAEHLSSGGPGQSGVDGAVEKRHKLGECPERTHTSASEERTYQHPQPAARNVIPFQSPPLL